MSVRYQCQKCGRNAKCIKASDSYNHEIDVGSRLYLCKECEWEMIELAEVMNMPVDEIWEMV